MKPTKAYILKINTKLSDIYSETAARSCRTIGLPYEFFYGVEGVDQYEAFKSLPFPVEVHHSQFDPAACVTVSHYLLWQKIVDTNECAIILEHDGIMLHAVDLDIPDNLIVVLGYKLTDPKSYNYKAAGSPRELVSVEAHSGCHAYCITPTTAKALLDELKNIGVTESIDNRYFLRDKPEKVSGIPLAITNPTCAIGWLRKSTVWENSWEFNYLPLSTFTDNMNQKAIRLHVLGVPHTKSTREYTTCAFTQKLINSCEMFKSMGMEVIHYGHPDSQVDCDEHVDVVSRETFDKEYAHIDWKKDGIPYLKEGLNDVYTESIENSIIEIGKRKQPHDFILTYWGGQQRAVCEAHEELLGCEPSIGYPSEFANLRVYESYAMLHMMSGQTFMTDIKNHFFHAVIPSAFKLENFEYRSNKENYFVHIGRLGHGKGTHIAIDVCKHIGAELVIMGAPSDPKSAGVGDRWPDHVKFIGFADIETRKHYLSRAKALFCPTLYTEPYGFVAVEAQLSGTPVICTDWGGFTETVLHGTTGYRCRTFEQFCWAAKNIETIDPAACRYWSETNYNFNKIGRMYKEYFEMVLNFFKDERRWFAPSDSRTELAWLSKKYI